MSAFREHGEFLLIDSGWTRTGKLSSDQFSRAICTNPLKCPAPHVPYKLPEKQNKTKRGNATRPVGLGPGQLRPGERGDWFYQWPVPPAEKRGSRQKAQATQGRGPRLSPGKWNLFHRKQRSALRWGQNRFTKRGVRTEGCVLLCEPMVKENFYLIAHSFCTNGQETTKAKTRQGPKG